MRTCHFGSDFEAVMAQASGTDHAMPRELCFAKYQRHVAQHVVDRQAVDEMIASSLNAVFAGHVGRQLLGTGL